MNTFTYRPDLTDLTVIKDFSKQENEFFRDGHPNFLIPDFFKNPACKDIADIWITFLEYLEKKYTSIYDQEGGEVSDHKIIDSLSGLTSCIYTAYCIQKDEDSEPVDIKVEVEGYVVEDNKYDNNGSTPKIFFYATKVTEHSKL